MNQEKSSKIKKCIIAFIIMAILVAIDQWTKHLAIFYLKEQNAYPIWKDVFELQYLENRGAAFGFMQGKTTLFLIFTILIVLLTCFIFYQLPSGKRYWWTHVISVLMVSGAIGNFIDRVYRNYVVDFFYFKLINFPIFNVADIYVVIAVAMMIVCIFYYKEEDFDKIFSFYQKKEN